MLAMVSTEAKELVQILAAHIYTACPTAIPTLPHPSKDSSEEELMEGLGMAKDKNGEYETFERFLSRTEVRSNTLGSLLLYMYASIIQTISFFGFPRASFRSSRK